MHVVYAILWPLAVLAILFAPLERFLPAAGNTRRSRKALVADALHATIGALIIRFGVAVMLMLLAPASPAVRLHGVCPVWLQFAVLLLVSDLTIWIVHRAFHAIPVLWRFHRIHHSSEHLDWFSTSRVHPLEQIAFATATALPMLVAEFSPQAIALYAGAYTVHSYLLHANTRLGFGPLEAIFTAPRIHHWHHADQPEAYDTNFGSQLVLWDKMFGTAYRPQALRPSRFGVDDPPPEGFGDHLIAPFRLRKRQPEPAISAEQR